MRKRRIALAVVLAAASCGPRLPGHPSGEAALTIDGQVKRGPFVLGRQDLAALPRRTFRAVDPSTGREAAYEGIALAPIFLERVETKKGADTAVVKTRDGRAEPVPLRLFQQYRPVLADHLDGAVLPGLVLAWPNVDQPGLDGDPRALALWGHDVLSLEVVAWETRYARPLRLPPGEADAARLGAETFVSRCIACHRARGVGGTAGPDLTGGGARLSPDAFARAVAGHRLAPVNRPDRGPSEDAIRDIGAYLRALAAAPPLEEGEKPAAEADDRRRERGGDRDGEEP